MPPTNRRALTGLPQVPEQTVPATPAAGLVEFYAKVDKKPYVKGSDGVERKMYETGTVKCLKSVLFR